MSPALPPVAPEVLTASVAALPDRLRRRLDEVAAQAASWPVTDAGGGAVCVNVDEHTTVTLAHPVVTAADAACSCLLAPRCLHRAGLLAIAPIHHSVSPDAKPPDSPPPVAPHPTTGPQREAVQRLWRSVADLLEYGVAGAGEVSQATILRAVHDVRSVGLPHPAALGLRVVEQVRAARAEEPQFRLGSLTDDLRDLLAACHTLATGHGDQSAARGIARREFRPVGNLRLYGLCCEPVVTSSGYAGVVTHLSDRQARLWTISAVEPGDVNRARTAGDRPVSIGEARLSYRDLGRAGLVVSGAYAEAGGRLSKGRQVQAAAASGCAWDAPPLDALWLPPLAEQVTRYHDALGVPLPDRSGGHDLAFLTVLIHGSAPRGVLVEELGTGVTVTVMPPNDEPVLRYVPNLRLLAAHARGHQVRLIGRFAGPRVLDAVAFAAGWLPERYRGHVDLGIDELRHADLPGPEPAPADPPDLAPDADGGPNPLRLLRHRLERAVTGGRRTLSATSPAPTPLPTAAAVLADLHQAAARRDRDAFGRRASQDTDRLARAWLAAAVYESAAARAISATHWSRAPGL